MITTLLLFFAASISLGSPQQTREPERHRTVIVGAGAAGIAAAVHLLESANATDFIILEASDRIGGRIESVEFGGVTVDKGAGFVHEDSDAYDLVNSYDLLVSYKKTMAQPEQILFTNPAGDNYDSEYVDGLVDKAKDIMTDADVFGQNISLAQYFHSKLDKLLQENNVDSKLGEAVRRVAVGDLCVTNGLGNLTELGPDYAELKQTDEKDHTLMWKPGSGGYQKMIDVLIKKFPDPAKELPVINRTRFGKEVAEINYEQRKPGVMVECLDGSKYLADHVIVTVSLGVLKMNASDMFDPALSRKRFDAIDYMGFGLVEKVFVLFPTKWWPQQITTIIPLLTNEELEDIKKNTKHGYWMTNVVRFYPVLGNDRMLMFYLTGDACRAMESLKEEEVTDGIVEFLSKTLGKKFNIPRPEKILRTSWASNPYIRGSYSFRSVESDKRHVNNRELFQPRRNKNRPVVLFAGEATSTFWPATVHGALGTGRRHAMEIANMYKSKRYRS